MTDEIDRIRDALHPDSTTYAQDADVRVLLAEYDALRAERDALAEALREGAAGLRDDGHQWSKRNDGLGHQVCMQRYHEAHVLRLALALLENRS